MNLEVEAYPGELVSLRGFRDDIIGQVELPAEVTVAIDAMDVTEMTKACLRQAMESIHALKRASAARSGQ